MIADVKPGDVVGLGGRVAIVPERCECGRTATTWEANAFAMVGSCDGCREDRRSWGDWRAKLFASLDLWDAEAAWRDLTIARCLLGSSDPDDVAEGRKEVERIRVRHGLPSALDATPRPLSR